MAHNTLLIVLALWIAACGKESASDNDTDHPDDMTPDAGAASDAGPVLNVTGVSIITPTDGEQVSGLVPVEVGYGGGVRFAEIAYALDDAELRLARGPGALSLDTLAMDNGTHSVSVSVTTEDGDTYQDTVEFEVDNPTQRLLAVDGLSAVYSRGDDISLQLRYDRPGLDVRADFSAVDGTESPVAVADVGDGEYELRHTLASSEQKTARVVLEASEGDGAAVIDRVPVRLRSQPPLPLVVEGAILVDDDLPPFEVDSEGDSGLTLSGSNGLVGKAKTPLAVKCPCPA
jgi:hypothetical protein